MSKFASLLYATPSFLSGMARTLDIGCTFDSYNTSGSAEEADRIAIASDWYAVGSDLRHVTNRYASQVGHKATNARRHHS
jgi:hypothetical protein